MKYMLMDLMFFVSGFIVAIVFMWNRSMSAARKVYDSRIKRMEQEHLQHLTQVEESYQKLKMLYRELSDNIRKIFPDIKLPEL